jgi:hypothetical protein
MLPDSKWDLLYTLSEFSYYDAIYIFHELDRFFMMIGCLMTQIYSSALRYKCWHFSSTWLLCRCWVLTWNIWVAGDSYISVDNGQNLVNKDLVVVRCAPILSTYSFKSSFSSLYFVKKFTIDLLFILLTVSE